MTEKEWLAGEFRPSTFRWLGSHSSLRQRILAGCAGCRLLGSLIGTDLERVVGTLEQYADNKVERPEVERCRPVLDDLAVRARERWHQSDRELSAAARAWEQATDRASETAPTAPLFTGAEWLLARAARLEAATRSAAVETASDLANATLAGDSDHFHPVVTVFETAERLAEASAMSEFALNWERRAEELAEQFGRYPRRKRQIAAEAQEWVDRGMMMLDSASDRRIREARTRCERDFLRTLHDIIGNPFRPVPFDPRWKTADVVGLARGIYEDRAFERMPLLADALMDAGCADERVIAHCREPGAHYRGCWAVDAVLDLNPIPSTR
jgi:hypothetical protein